MPSNYKTTDDIQILFTSTLQESPIVNVGFCESSLGPDYDLYSFTSQLSPNTDPDASPFKIKKYKDSLNGLIGRNREATDPAKQLFVSSAFVGDIPYQEEIDSGFFLSQCWSDQIPAAPALDTDWASTLANALGYAGQKVKDLNQKASKTLIQGLDVKNAGPLIFSCEDFVQKVIPRLYGLKRDLAFEYQLDSTINLTSSIKTSAKGERYFCVEWTEKDPGTADTAGSPQGKKKSTLAKALIIINEKTDLQVRIHNVISSAEAQALALEFADYSGMSQTNTSWESKVNAFVDIMDLVRDNNTPLPSGALVQHEESIGNGILRIQIVRDTNAGGGSWFYVGATFSIGGGTAGNPLGIKFEGITIQFSPVKYFQEREMIKQLRARYKEAMENYQRELQLYQQRIAQTGGTIVPQNQSPPPTDLLANPTDTIPVPPNGQAPSRESIAEAMGIGAQSSGAINITLPPPPIPELSDFIRNSGSNTRIIDSVSWTLIRGD